ncbi:MAG: hypothetical protein PVJ38_04600, partial [Candidatus Bathyarchaeota archaeon]
MERMIHNGVLVPPRYEGVGLTVRVKGEEVELNDEQEEMALAWAKKMGTPYVEDPEFADNFHRDFSEVLGIEVLPGDVDFSSIRRRVVEERELKANRSKEERKRLREERKAVREANKERYGWATIDRERMEVANYMVEPSSIFMGRGEHPMRGRWKEGPRHGDVELNLSPDAPVPPGDWKTIVWEPDSLWIARWRDKLSDKMKYVWLHDSSPLKQEKDIEKFNTARELREILPQVQEHINENLDHGDLQRRKTATVTFLIDYCKFRVGDEKDEDEAETIGASTLKPEHLSFNGDGSVTFDFLGKDSVRHYLRVKMPQKVINNLLEFSEEPDDELFDGVDSKRVSEFLDEVKTGLSAKVFRTHYSSTAVENKLRELGVDPDDPDYRKKHMATIANLEAAKVCNHKRTIPRSWAGSLERQKERLGERRERAVRNVEKYREKIKETEKRYRDRIARYRRKLVDDRGKLEEYREELKEREAEGRATKGIKNRIASKRRVIRNGGARILKTRKKLRDRLATLKERLENRKRRDRALIEKTE